MIVVSIEGGDRRTSGSGVARPRSDFGGMMLQAPDWVSTGSNPIKGLDLLGLRLPVQNIGVQLLDGITSITPTVRYLSFYTWIADRYRQSELPDRWSDFRRFGTAQEAAIVMANLTVNRNLSGLIGSQEGNYRLDGNGNRLSLDPLVVQPAINTYANASAQLNLTFESESSSGIPGLTKERGLLLANCFGDRIRKTDFVRRLAKKPAAKTVLRSELEELGPLVAVNELPSAERDIITNALIPPEPLPKEIPRLASYALMLYSAKEESAAPTEDVIFSYAHLPTRQLPDIFRKTLDGWLQYLARDLIAVTHEAVLAAVVSEAYQLSRTQKGPVKSDLVIRSLLENVALQNNALRDLGLLTEKETYVDLRFRGLVDRVNAACKIISSKNDDGLARWKGPLSETSVYTSALNSGPAAVVLLPVAWCLAMRRAKSAISEGHPSANFLSTRSWARFGFPDIIIPNFERLRSENAPLPEVVAELITRTIDQHLRIAWARARTDLRRDVALLVVEGDSWMSRGNYMAGRTLSRLPQAIGWLRQLGMIDHDGLTASGKKALTRAHRALERGPQ